MATQLKRCQNCGTENSGFESFCRNCGTMLAPSYENRQVQERAPAGMQRQVPGADKKILSGILGILLGALGIHKFVLGYNTEGIIMLLVSLVGGFLLCGIPTVVMSIIGIIEGVLYLTKSDEEFVDTYIRGKKGWF